MVGVAPFFLTHGVVRPLIVFDLFNICIGGATPLPRQFSICGSLSGSVTVRLFPYLHRRCHAITLALTRIEQLHKTLKSETKWLQNRSDGSGIFRLRNRQDGFAILRLQNCQFPCLFLLCPQKT